MNRQFARLVALVAQRDYLRTVRRRGFVAGTLLLPLGMVAIFAVSTLASSGAGEPSGPILVVDESSIGVVSDPTVAPNVVVVDRVEADRRLASHEASEYYLVPNSWPATPDVLVVSGAAATGQPQVAFIRQSGQQAEVQTALRISLVRASGLPPALIGQIMSPVAFKLIDTSGQPTTQATALGSYLVPYAFTMIFMLSIFITSGYLLQSVTEEKENRVVEIVLSSVPALPLMAGKILGLGAAGLTQVVIWVATALVALPLLNAQLALSVSIAPLTLVLAVVCFALGYLAYGAIYAAVGALSPGAREAQQYASFFGVIAVIPIVLLPAILTDPGSPLAVALCVLPMTAPAALLAVLAVSTSVPWVLVALSLLSQIAFVAIAVVGASRIFRATLLLYGVRPSLRRIGAALFAR